MQNAGWDNEISAAKRLVRGSRENTPKQQGKAITILAYVIITRVESLITEWFTLRMSAYIHSLLLEHICRCVQSHKEAGPCFTSLQ